MLELLVLALSGLGLAGGVVSLRAADGARWRQSLEAFELQFSSGIEPKAVIAFVTGIAGIVAPRLERPFVVRAVVFEIHATVSGIRFYLLIPPPLTDVVVGSLRASVPGVVVKPATNYRPKAPVVAAELGLSDPNRPMNTEAPSSVTAGLLSSLQPVEEAGEELRVQWILSPVGPLPAPPPPPSNSSAPKVLIPNVTATVRSREAWRAALAKRSGVLFDASIRLGVVAPSFKRAAQLLNRMSAPFHAANAAGVNLYRRRVSNRAAVSRLNERRVPILRFPCTFNGVELSGLLGIPTGSLELEGLSLGVSRLRPPTPDIPRKGLVLCEGNYPGRERPCAIDWIAVRSHVGTFGPTGAGKSVFVGNATVQAMEAGHGVLLIDPHGDLAVEVVRAMPESRTKDLLWIAPHDEVVTGLNVLAGMAATPELAADLVINALRHRWGGSSWGPRMEQLLWAAVVTLTATGQTLVELQRIFTDDTFRRRLVAKLDDPFGAVPIFARYESWSEGERAQAAAACLNKSAFDRPELRVLVGQRTSVDFDAALRDGKVIVVSIPKGRLGTDAVQTVAGLILGAYWMAVLRRAGVPEAERRTNLVVLDEAHELLSLPTSVGLALSESRKYGTGWLLNFQSIGQIPTRGGFRLEVLANLRTKVSFATSAADAELLAREFGPDVKPEDLQHLGQREVLIAPSVGGRTVAPFTGVALAPAPSTGSFELRIAESQRRHGRLREEVEAELRQRYDEPGPTDRVRRRRRL